MSWSTTASTWWRTSLLWARICRCPATQGANVHALRKPPTNTHATSENKEFKLDRRMRLKDISAN